MPTFTELSIRLNVLDGHFLPAAQTQIANIPTSDNEYSAEELDLIAAYPVFVHAEIEYFCEELAKDAALRALSTWRSGSPPSFVLWSLILDDTLQNKSRGLQELDDAMINKAVTNFVSRLTASHGIKTKNIQTIFRPIGIKKADLDPLWLEEMEWLGKQRGGIVHKSVGARSVSAPELLRRKIQSNILPPLEALAAKVSGL